MPRAAGAALRPRGPAGLTAACAPRAALGAASGSPSLGSRHALALKQAGQLSAFCAGDSAPQRPESASGKKNIYVSILSSGKFV